MPSYIYDETVKELREQGLSYGKIADRIGISKNTVRSICDRVNNGGSVWQKKFMLFSELRKNGLTYQEIADTTGYTHDQVEYFCQRWDLSYSASERSAIQKANKGHSWSKGKALIDWGSKVEEKTSGTFELLSLGDTLQNGERKLLVRCRKCGTDREISSNSLKGNNQKVVCCKCRELNSRLVKANREYEIITDKYREDKRKARKKMQDNQKAFKFCECGSLLLSNQKFCDECKENHRKSRERKREHRRRIREHTCFDKTITLEKLYERDNGICYLCNKACDWGDFQKVNGVFYVGGSYPTVEHIKPLCKGGSHTWDNVKLACFACNAKKGRKYEEEQSLGS